MANWTDTHMSLIIRNDEIEKFLSYLNEENYDENKNHLLEYPNNVLGKQETINDKYSLLKLTMECRWNIEGTFCPKIDWEFHSRGWDEKHLKNTIELVDILKECKVKKCIVDSTDYGCGFREYISYKEGEDLIFDVEDLHLRADEIYYDDLDLENENSNEFELSE